MLRCWIHSAVSPSSFYAVWLVSSCPDGGIHKGPSHLRFVLITFCHFSFICNILYSSPCALKWCPFPAKCLPNHPHNHHTILICRFVMSIQHDTSYCSTIFLLLIKILYIYLTPLSPARMLSVTVVLSCGFGTTWNLGVPVLQRTHTVQTLHWLGHAISYQHNTWHDHLGFHWHFVNVQSLLHELWLRTFSFLCFPVLVAFVISVFWCFTFYFNSFASGSLKCL